MTKKTATTEQIMERVHDALRTAKGRMTADELARVAGCTKSKLYLIIGLLRGLHEASNNNRTTISSRRGVGYRIAGLDDDGQQDDVQKQIDILMEATKSGERAFSHLRRQAKLIPMVNKAMLSDPDQIELLSINIGMQAAMAIVFNYEDRLKSVASNITKKHLLDAKEETSAPSKAFGVKTFAELMADAKDDDDEAA